MAWTSVDLPKIWGAVARGWCTPENEHKVMDPDLALAIADEVAKTFREVLERSWGIIANVSQWEDQSAEWQDAARRWRDEIWHPFLDSVGTADHEAPLED